jgi:DNA polymerase-3 subunit epsilon
MSFTVALTDFDEVPMPPERPRSTDLSFVAFDVETANRARGSICELGWTVVEDGRIVSADSTLVRPPGELNYFEGINVGTHGIHSADVANAPTFVEGLGSFLDAVGDRLVVTHNAAFDIGALRDACYEAGVDHPTLDYVCSLVLSRRELALISYRLPLVAAELGVPTGLHHRAATDSTVAAGIVLELCRRRGVATVEDLADELHVRVGRLVSGRFSGVSSIAKPLGGWHAGPPDPNATADPDHPLYGQVMVFTGALSLTRAEAWEWAASVGAVPDERITKKTTILVIGDGFAGQSAEEFTTGKAKKAVEALAKGQKIEVFTERDFFDALGSPPSPA